MGIALFRPACTNQGFIDDSNNSPPPIQPPARAREPICEQAIATKKSVNRRLHSKCFTGVLLIWSGRCVDFLLSRVAAALGEGKLISYLQVAVW